MSEHGHHRNYVKIWAILVGLLVVSVLGPMTHIHVVILITAFGIALVKAYLVAKNFMHLDVEKPIIHWMMAIALVFMVLLFAGVSPDVMKDHGRRWQKGPGFHPVERVGHEGPEGAAEHGGAMNGEAGHAATEGGAATGSPPSGFVGSDHDSTGSQP